MTNRSKARGTARCCQICNLPMPFLDGRSSRRRYCSPECINAARRATYTPRTPAVRPSLATRLWSRIRETPSGCWEFTGYVDAATGYGQIGNEGRLVLTHRASWELTHGPIPSSLVIRHKCDNRPCINPEHLEIGTQADNVRDALERGRVARKFGLPHTRLSDDDVRSIRHSYASGTPSATLARQFGISSNYVTQLARRSYRSDVK